MIVIRFLFNLAVFLIPAALAGLGCRALSRTSNEEWRLLAWVPAVPLAGWALFVAWGVTRDPTSHNLWPFELVIWGVLSLALLLLFLVARRFLGGPRTDWAARRQRDRSA